MFGTINVFNLYHGFVQTTIVSTWVWEFLKRSSPNSGIMHLRGGRKVSEWHMEKLMPPASSTPKLGQSSFSLAQIPKIPQLK
jgi:hypothetical protein